MGERERWALIDLRELRTQLENDELAATDFETRKILNYDFMIIMPGGSEGGEALLKR